MPRIRILLLAAWLVLVTAGLPAFVPALARAADEPILVDRIVAIVDEEAILASDLERAVELSQLDRQYQGQQPEPVTPELRKQVLDSLIESKLIIAAAKQADLRVEEEDIDKQVKARIDDLEKQYGSRDALVREMNRAGMSIDDFRTRYANQLRDQQYLRLVVGKFIRPHVEVMENEVQQYYLDHIAEMPAEPDSLTISDILVRVQPSEEARRAVQRKVAEAQDALRRGQDFASVAMQYSEGPNAQRGGRIGVVKPGDLFDRSLEQSVFALPIGKVSDPIISSRGVHVVKVDAIDPDGGRTLSQVFFPLQPTQADVDAAKQRIAAARERVESGTPFSLVAEELSEDPTSAKKGGLLGTFQLSDLSEQFQSVLKDTEAGQITEPLLTPAGWYLFLVADRTHGHQYTYDELKDDLRHFVENQKIEKELTKYVDSLKDRFYVDIKS